MIVNVADQPQPSQGAFMTPEARDAEYIANGGSRCPNCGSSHIQADDINMDCLQAWQDVTCHDCNATWVEVFNLVGISNLQVPD